MGLSVVLRPAVAQELNLRPLPLPVQSGAPPVVLPSQSQAMGKDDSAPKDTHVGQQKGTSNDRILWTLPNFLTLENAENIPPLSPGQRFKATARRLFDPFEFVLIGFVAGLGQASNSNPSYGQGMQGYAKRYGTAFGDNLIENFMASAALPSVLHQDTRDITNWVMVVSCGGRGTPWGVF